MRFAQQWLHMGKVHDSEYLNITSWQQDQTVGSRRQGEDPQGYRTIYSPDWTEKMDNSGN